MSDYIIQKHTTAAAPAKMQNAAVKNLWHSFCLTEGELSFVTCQGWHFCIGDAVLPVLDDRAEYALTVSAHGVAVVGRDFGGLMRGFMALLMKFTYTRDGIRLAAADEKSRYRVKNRMLHICVFPENDLMFLKRIIRLAALCQYTHIVIEFWGMLRYDCLPALSWPCAFTKDEAAELVGEARALGLEPVPMFNHLGHAAASRSCYGKHVVLNQDPRLQYLFTPDGWVWDICSDEVKALLRQVRRELYALFGEGSYIHLGCDEANYISRHADLRRKLPAYLRQITNEVQTEGRRPMLWMDMLLEKDVFENCYAVGDKDEVQHLRDSTAASTVFVDWQYERLKAPVPSLLSLAGSGRDVMGAPWHRPQNYLAHIDTVAANDLFGIMLTTWDRLHDKTPSVPGCAFACGAAHFPWGGDPTGGQEETAALWRRVCFEDSTYAACGWAKKQIEV